MVLRIFKCRRTLKFHDCFKNYDNVFLSMINKGFFISGTNLLWLMREVAGEGLWLLVTGGRCQVTCYVTCDFLYKKARKVIEKCLNVQING